MISNYFKIAWRHLINNRLYSLINLAGLTIGLTGCLLIGIYIGHEWDYDKFHENSDRITRVTWEYSFDGTVEETALTGTRVGPEFSRKFPEVESFVRLLKNASVVSYESQQFEENNFLYADSTFFKIFSFPLLKGNAENVLSDPNSMVITRSMATKYFGEQDPVGKTLKVGGKKEYVITGIADNVPDNSQIKFDFIVPFSCLNAAKYEKWSEANYITFLLMKEAGSLESLQSKITNYMQRISEEEMKLEGSNYFTYHIQLMEDVHLYGKFEGFEPNSSFTYIWILGAVAFLILLIACVNYTNLSIAQASGRSTEVGMRKAMGAERKNIFFQFISEAFNLTLIALILSLVSFVLLLPFFNQLAGKQLDASVVFEPTTFGLLIVLSFIVALLAGAYPALILSQGKLIKVLKNGFSFTGSPILRNSLIVFQFVITIFLIIATVAILQQLNYIQNRDLGYSKEQVLVLPVDSQIRRNYDAIKAQFENIEGVKAIAGAYEKPTHVGWSDAFVKLENNKSISVNAMPVDEKIVETLDFQIIAGEDFTPYDITMADPITHGDNILYTFILNESAAQALGWTPEEAIGKKVSKGREGIVRAVVKDFHFRSLHEPISPLIIFMDKRLINYMFIKLDETNIPSTLASIEDIWKERVPHRPFDYQFLDENYKALYKAEQSIAGVFTTFSGVAILLACLGLFALTAFSMVRRSKEIGIRKIMGATVPKILAMVSKDFILLVTVSIFIAIPISLFAVNKWLENFTYRITVEWWVIALACVATLVIAITTVCIQGLKTALQNPVKNLKTE
ncbi:ABC transporter permease [Aquiflexum sp.]|uniref:ABC transporter permease n=1 Tax=Aquiflexum sp. TaxID=1872584 RepID=UPI0035937C6B